MWIFSTEFLDFDEANKSKAPILKHQAAYLEKKASSERSEEDEIRKKKILDEDEHYRTRADHIVQDILEKDYSGIATRSMLVDADEGGMLPKGMHSDELGPESKLANMYEKHGG